MRPDHKVLMNFTLAHFQQNEKKIHLNDNKRAIVMLLYVICFHSTAKKRITKGKIHNNKARMK